MPKFLHTGHFSGSSTDLTLDGQLFLPSTTTSPGAATPISFDSGHGGMWYDSDSDYLYFRAASGDRAYVGSAGVFSNANFYTGTTGQFRNYGGVWAGTTGVANSGFYFLNTANSNTIKAMELTANGSMMTVAGMVKATKYLDKDNTNYFINPKASSGADAAMLLGRVRIGSNEAGAISNFGVGGRTQIQTMNYKADVYGSNGQYNGISVFANDATISNSATGTTALVLHNTLSSTSNKALLRLTRTDGRTNNPFSSGLGSYSTRFEIMGDGSVNISKNLNVSGTATISGPILTFEGSGDQTNSADSATLPSTTTEEYQRISYPSSYTDGRYTHEWAKIDRGGNLPLYLRQSKSTANSFTNLARFGDHSNSIHEFEVFGSIKATHFYGDGSNLTNLPSGNTTTINNNANNRVITGSGTADTLEAESGLTFDGDDLVIVADGTTNKRLYISSDTDYGRAYVGRAYVGKLGFDDHAGFSHIDHNTQTNYAVLQNNAGSTFLNAATGAAGYFR